MPTGLIALSAFIAVIIIWNVACKRNMGEAMLLGFLVTAAFAGPDAPEALVTGLRGALDEEVLYAAMAFVFMAYAIDRTGLIGKILTILNSLVGRIRGGPVLVDATGSAAMGALSGSNSGNTAATGSFTGPWMVRTGWSPERSATFMAGNGGLGAAMPPSSSMVIMIGFAGSMVTTGQVYLALLCAGIYQLAWRVLLIAHLARRDGIQRAPSAELQPLSRALREGGAALTIVLGALVPIAITVGPIASTLSNNNLLGASLNEISILTWIPVLVTALALLIGRRTLPRGTQAWADWLVAAMPRFTSIGALLFFAVAASETLTNLGLAGDIEAILSDVHLNKYVMALLVGVLIAVIAGPLSSTATLTAVGHVSLLALVSVGVDPVLAVTAILVFASTEGASPPASGSIFVAAGITGAKPEKMFLPLIGYYMLPIMLIGCLIAWGVLPVLT